MDKKPKRPPTPWQQKLDALQSISLRSIAKELNARRLKALNEVLRDPTPKIQKRMNRLCRMVENHGWPLLELPTDMRADGERMKLALIAFYRVMKGQQWLPVKESALAELMAKELCLRTRAKKQDPRTARRAIADLRDANLIGVQARLRPAFLGGQAENGYLVVWATIHDLAASQGVQLKLFDVEELSIECGAPASNGAAATVAGTPGHRGNPPGHNGNAVGHCGRPPGHGGNPPGHSGNEFGHGGHPPAELPISARTHAGAPSLPFSSEQSSSSSDRPEKEKILRDPGWQRVLTLLTEHDVDAKVLACRAAFASGWTADQAAAFVSECLRKQIDGVRAWKPGQVYWQLSNGDPGSKISTPPTEAYRRKFRDKQQQLHSVSKRSSEAEEQARIRADRNRRLGPTLDAMGFDELSALARQVSPDMEKRFRQVGLGGGIRDVLLVALERREAAKEATP